MRAEQIEILLDRAVAVGAGAAGLGERSAQAAHFLGRRAVDVGESRLDQVARELVQAIEVVGRVIEMRAPVEAQPAHRRHDRVVVLDVLLDRIGIVEAQVAGAAILGGEPEVQADRLGVPDVQVAVGLGWKAGDDAPAVLARAQILGDDLAQKIRDRRWRRISCRRCSTHLRFVHEQMTSECHILTGGVGAVIGRYARRMRATARETRIQQGFAACRGLRARWPLSTLSVDKSVHIL